MRVTLYTNEAEPIEGFVDMKLPIPAVNNFIHAILTKDVIPAIHRETRKLIESAEGFRENHGGWVAVFRNESNDFIRYVDWRRDVGVGDAPALTWVNHMQKKRLNEFPFQRFEWIMEDPDTPSYGIRNFFTYRYPEAPKPLPLRSERLVLEKHITTWVMDTLIAKGNNNSFIVKVRMDDPWLRDRIRESFEMFNGSYAPTFRIEPRKALFIMNKEDPLYLYIHTRHTAPREWPNDPTKESSPQVDS